MKEGMTRKGGINRETSGVTTRPDAPGATEHVSENSSKLTNPDMPFHERLRVLCGYVENDSDTVVKVSQDDATRGWVVVVGSETRGTARRYYGTSMDDAFEQAFTDPKNDPV